ncbi:MAG TPA: slipin family protein [Gemmataceae bacterium]|nr:slipin family protein [Gemmataceae bacterium]
MNELIIKDTHRGLYYEDGVLARVLTAGRYELPLTKPKTLFGRRPKTEVVLVDVRRRDLTLKNQEILTSDKVAIRVSILVQFAVTDPTAAIHTVANYEDRLYSDVQLAARRALAAMTLEEILTNRTRLSEEILRDVQGAARGYGVAIDRADVKDLVFPGNLQEIMNRVLAAERMSQAQLVEARTKAEVQRIEAQTRADAQRVQAQADAEAARCRAEAEAEATRLAVQAEVQALEERRRLAAAYQEHPALLRLEELAALKELGRNGNARLYVDFPGAAAAEESEEPRGS